MLAILTILNHNIQFSLVGLPLAFLWTDPLQVSYLEGGLFLKEPLGGAGSGAGVDAGTGSGCANVVEYLQLRN